MARATLDIRHLEMIAAFARSPRVTDAAEQLGITPSALSHRIREVERRLEVPLFIRVNKRLRPTAAANHLTQVATRLLSDLARAEADVRKMAQGVRHVARLSVESYSSYHWLPAFVRHLREREPDIGLQVVAGAARSPLTSLGERGVDLVIVSGDRARPLTDAIHLFDDELLFIMPPQHPLADKSFIDANDVVGEDFITYTRVPEPDREYAKLFRPNDSYPKWTETVELPEAIVEMVAAGLGTSVLAGWAVRDSIHRGRIVGARVGANGISVPWYAVTRAGAAGDHQLNHRVASLLAEWCADTKGFDSTQNASNTI